MKHHHYVLIIGLVALLSGSIEAFNNQQIRGIDALAKKILEQQGFTHTVAHLNSLTYVSEQQFKLPDNNNLLQQYTSKAQSDCIQHPNHVKSIQKLRFLVSQIANPFVPIKLKNPTLILDPFVASEDFDVSVDIDEGGLEFLSKQDLSLKDLQSSTLSWGEYLYQNPSCKEHTPQKIMQESVVRAAWALATLYKQCFNELTLPLSNNVDSELVFQQVKYKALQKENAILQEASALKNQLFDIAVNSYEDELDELNDEYCTLRDILRKKEEFAQKLAGDLYDSELEKDELKGIKGSLQVLNNTLLIRVKSLGDRLNDASYSKVYIKNLEAVIKAYEDENYEQTLFYEKDLKIYEQDLKKYKKDQQKLKKRYNCIKKINDDTLEKLWLASRANKQSNKYIVQLEDDCALYQENVEELEEYNEGLALYANQCDEDKDVLVENIRTLEKNVLGLRSAYEELEGQYDHSEQLLDVYLNENNDLHEYNESLLVENQHQKIALEMLQKINEARDKKITGLNKAQEGSEKKENNLKMVNTALLKKIGEFQSQKVLAEKLKEKCSELQKKNQQIKAESKERQVAYQELEKQVLKYKSLEKVVDTLQTQLEKKDKELLEEKQDIILAYAENEVLQIKIKDLQREQEDSCPWSWNADDYSDDNNISYSADDAKNDKDNENQLKMVADQWPLLLKQSYSNQNKKN